MSNAERVTLQGRDYPPPSKGVYGNIPDKIDLIVGVKIDVGTLPKPGGLANYIDKVV